MSKFMLELVLNEVIQAGEARSMLDVDVSLARIFPMCVTFGDTKSDIHAALIDCALDRNVSACFKNSLL